MSSVGVGERRIDWMISVDDHVLEPPNVWQDRLPVAFREQGPRIVHEGGSEFWWYEGKMIPTSGLSAVAGKSYDEVSPRPLTYDEMRPGCYDPVARLPDMDRAGVVACLNFPSFPRFAGQTFLEGRDPVLGGLCVQAWNDWMLDEWCAAAPGRYIPATIIPFWDVAASVAEIERCVAKGSKGIIFTENPARLKFQGEYLPSIHAMDRHWDPIWAVLQETRVPLLMHYGSSSYMTKTADDAPPLVELAANNFINPITTTLDWLFSGNLGRFPGMRICMSESQIGWIAPALERAENVMRIQGAWGTKLLRGGDMGALPSDRQLRERDVELFVDERSLTQIFKDQVFCSFFSDFVGLKTVRDLGALDNIMIEMDYPHTDSTWPNSLQLGLQQVESLDHDDKWKVLAGNAMKLHSFEPAYPDITAPIGASV